MTQTKSFSRAEPTTLGGTISKLPHGFTVKPSPGYDAEMETTLQQAEARGEYNPWNKEVDDEPA